VPVPEVFEATPRKRRAGLAAVAIGLLAVIGGSVAVWNRKPAATAPVPRPAPARASVVVNTPGRIAINAFPWANVTNIRNAATGAVVPAGAVVTPVALDVPAGRYEVTLANPAFQVPETRIVDVTPGAEVALNVQFADAADAPLPTFLGGSR
jgi:predicted RecA/RadA family phage recombinase